MVWTPSRILAPPTLVPLKRLQLFKINLTRASNPNDTFSCFIPDPRKLSLTPYTKLNALQSREWEYYCGPSKEQRHNCIWQREKSILVIKESESSLAYRHSRSLKDKLSTIKRYIYDSDDCVAWRVVSWRERNHRMPCKALRRKKTDFFFYIFHFQLPTKPTTRKK